MTAAQQPISVLRAEAALYMAAHLQRAAAIYTLDDSWSSDGSRAMSARANQAFLRAAIAYADAWREANGEELP